MGFVPKVSMVSKYDLLYSVFLNEGSTTAQLVKKLNKTSADYPNFFYHLKQLETEGLIEAKKAHYYLANQEKTKQFLRIIDFCVRNKIDYNELFLEKTIEFIELGLKGKPLDKVPFDSKTIARISAFLSKHGFILIESRKPFSAKIVCSEFLHKTVELFKEKVEVKCKKIFEDVDEKEIDSKIETEFSVFKKSDKELNPNDEVNFIYRSLSLEGNTLTLPETERLIRENIPPKNKSFKDMQDTMNYKKALEKFLEDKAPLNLDKILSFHQTAMGSLSAGAGEFRTQPVKIRGNADYKTADWHEISAKLNELFKYYNESIDKKMKPNEVIELASYLHAEFQRIHPFVDGNSRTSRALFAHTLMLKGFPLIISPAGFIDQYMGLTKLSKERNDKHFEIFMKQLVLHSLKQINWKMRFS
jgi:fido (protein-threonine AMPylation protein)